MGGILTGQFTPTEAGVIAVAYIVFVAIPLLNFRHLRTLPRDFAMTGLLYSIPLITIGAASVFGWTPSLICADPGGGFGVDC